MSEPSKFYFYVLQSQCTGKYYKGHCQDLQKRVNEHNCGRTKSTKHGVPWVLVHKEEFTNKEAAIFREQQSKTYRGGSALLEKLRNQMNEKV